MRSHIRIDDHCLLLETLSFLGFYGTTFFFFLLSSYFLGSSSSVQPLSQEFCLCHLLFTFCAPQQVISLSPKL